MVVQMDIYELMKQVNEWVKEILQDNYVGVYFHGSLRLGSFNPNKSDLDFIIVVKEK
nr:nucleotidyltransferase domain-containing protein [Campylobacter jejuni]